MELIANSAAHLAVSLLMLLQGRQRLRWATVSTRAPHDSSPTASARPGPAPCLRPHRERPAAAANPQQPVTLFAYRNSAPTCSSEAPTLCSHTAAPAKSSAGANTLCSCEPGCACADGITRWVEQAASTSTRRQGPQEPSPGQPPDAPKPAVRWAGYAAPRCYLRADLAHIWLQGSMSPLAGIPSTEAPCHI